MEAFFPFPYFRPAWPNCPCAPPSFLGRSPAGQFSPFSPSLSPTSGARLSVPSSPTVTSLSPFSRQQRTEPRPRSPRSPPLLAPRVGIGRASVPEPPSPSSHFTSLASAPLAQAPKTTAVGRMSLGVSSRLCPASRRGEHLLLPLFLSVILSLRFVASKALFARTEGVDNGVAVVRTARVLLRPC